MRHLPGRQHLHPLGRGARRPDLDPVLHHRHRARTARPARARRAPSPRASGRRRPTTPPAPTAPSRSNSTRPDGDQNLTGLNVTTPPGFSATLKGIPYCPDAALAAARRPELLGPRRAVAARAARPPARSAPRSPAPAPAPTRSTCRGKVYLAGPYKGAPLSLVVVTPAVSGPYDLGNVVVRAALHVDPIDRPGHRGLRSAAADPRRHPAAAALDPGQPRPPGLRPQPDQLRPVRGRRRRSSATEGARGDPPRHFQVANCAILPFAPKLSLRLTGGIKRRGHPALHAVLDAQPGEANIARVSVALPPGELLDNAHIGDGLHPGRSSPPTPARPDSVLGTRRSRSRRCSTSRSTGRSTCAPRSHKLPDLVARPQGPGRHRSSSARIDTVNGGLRTTFETVPDVPVSQVRLDLAGGTKGLLQNSESLCGETQEGDDKMIGQNGVTCRPRAPLETPSCGGKQRKKRGKR